MSTTMTVIIVQLFHRREIWKYVSLCRNYFQIFHLHFLKYKKQSLFDVSEMQLAVKNVMINKLNVHH